MNFRFETKPVPGPAEGCQFYFFFLSLTEQKNKDAFTDEGGMMTVNQFSIDERKK